MSAPKQKVSFEQLIAKVQQAEDVLEAHERGVAASYQRLRVVWRAGWTPLRIVSVGLVAGFVSGRAAPLRGLSGARTVQMVSAVSSLFATAQASFAANKTAAAADGAKGAEQAAANSASTTAAEPAAAVQAAYIPPSARTTRAAEQVHQSQPRAAEAATEVSER